MKYVKTAPSAPYASMGALVVDVPSGLSAAACKIILQISSGADVSDAWREVFRSALSDPAKVQHLQNRAGDDPEVQYTVDDAKVRGLATTHGTTLVLEFFL